jgi:putative transposase
MKRRHSKEQIVSILREVETRQKTITEICRGHAISENSSYSWRKKYGSMQESEVRWLKELEKENARLKRLLAERDVELDIVKEFLKKK